MQVPHMGDMLRPSDQLVVALLDGRRCALRLPAVERVARAVEITPLPKAPEIVLGVINVGGRIVPVINVRKRFRLAEREAGLGDQLLIARTARRTVALPVDAVTGVLPCSAEMVTTKEAIVPGLEYLEGIAKLEDGMILIHDLDKFLSLEEENTLDRALRTT